MLTFDDDDVSNVGGEYENGHWIWDDTTGALQFVNNEPENIVIETAKIIAPTGNVDFKDDIDLMEQMRFRRRYQRKLNKGEADVITVQDVKDIALYTAPLSIMSQILINMLHRPTTERFIRALILYCQYYFQVSEIISNRKKELQTKIRTPDCQIKEDQYRENLSDLRLLIAKEYCSILLGASDTKMFHHMGSNKEGISLSERDSRFFETLLRMCIQIIWLALERRSFNIIELEVNRLFKTEIFNAVEHTIHSNYIEKMTPEEKNVLLGKCVQRNERKLNIRSPLLNAAYCPRPIDYRMLALGVVKYNRSELSPRLKYFYGVISAPEETFLAHGIILGILGKPRKLFDTMLRRLPIVDDQNPNRSALSQRSMGSGGTKSQRGSILQKQYSEIILPNAEEYVEAKALYFNEEPEVPRPCNMVQRRRWQNRLARIQGNISLPSK